MIEKQSTEGVEAISGATNSSKGVIEAVNKALESAVK
ncbi:MAG: FMN-binding protein [Clostridium sp.]|nr:FMN-binding protein [Clostridium sp.]